MGRLADHQRHALIDGEDHVLGGVANLHRDLALDILLHIVGLDARAIAGLVQHQHHLLVRILQQVGDLQEELDIADAMQLKRHQGDNARGHIEHSQRAILERGGRINHDVVELAPHRLQNSADMIGAHQLAALRVGRGEQHLDLRGVGGEHIVKQLAVELIDALGQLDDGLVGAQVKDHRKVAKDHVSVYQGDLLVGLLADSHSEVGGHNRGAHAALGAKHSDDLAFGAIIASHSRGRAAAGRYIRHSGAGRGQLMDMAN